MSLVLPVDAEQQAAVSAADTADAPEPAVAGRQAAVSAAETAAVPRLPQEQATTCA